MSARPLIVAFAAIVIAIAVIARADNYLLFVLSLVGLTAIVGVGLNVLLGLTGQISFGHVAFYAIGAYTVGILTTKTALGFWIALPLGTLIAAIAGALLAIPALRVRGPYLAMVTIAFGFVIEQGAVEWSALTGGWNGLAGIPSPSLAGTELSERGAAYLVLACTVVAVLLYALLSASPWGRAMRALRDSETAGQSIGLDPILIRTTAFAFSAAAAGFAGGMFASISNFISPESFPFFQSILFVLVVMVGGAERVAGPVVGALIVVMLPEALSFLAQYRLLFVGLLLLVVLLVAPVGFVGLIGRFIAGKSDVRTARLTRDIAGFLTRPDQPALSVSALSVHFGGVRAVNALSFVASPGAITSVIGPNGAGKSTALNLIGGFYRADHGSVRLGDAEIGSLTSTRIAQAGVARTYQTTQLFATMSVIDNVLVALGRGRLGWSSMFRPDRDEERRARAESLLAFVGYRGSLHARAGALAHVDKRLVEIARALALQPTVLLLDEPAAGLDDADTARVGTLLGALARCGLVVVLVEHDMKLVMGVSNHVVVLDAGAKIAEGPPAAVAADPAVLKAYLGEGAAADRTRKGAAPDRKDELLLTRALRAGYGAVTVLRDIVVSVAQGETVAVLGPNGAGKSTLMRALSGLARPIEGDIRLVGEPIEKCDASEIAARGLVLVPEGRQVFGELSVIDNLRLGAYARPGADVAARAAALLARFPRLAARANQRAGLLSGGEQQMLAIARGLMARPRVLMLDEPSLGLAPKLVEDLFDLLAQLRDEGVTILLVDQAAALALSVADRGYVLQSGSIVHAGTADALRADPALAKAYLGEHGALAANSRE
ncbi:MAG TPA: branched-chain amino acid ABC transporter ATP-binding protein/permease [Xanthobacteraceae bacterium]|nr:branched-chain amino acid ABC transporter ATP-binding protein/permease [Xanthobacteraceae bacterium]